MPSYDFLNKNTNEVETHVMKISELDAFKESNQHLERYMAGVTPAFGDPVRLGIRKTDNGFREVLQKISERTPGGSSLRSNIR
jgi:cell fate (sporulation/competence/biofilm development) regulator YlbF (YheA/YmcA/DUF963 family)